MKNILYVGVDVDDKAFHVAVFNPFNEKLIEFSCKPKTNALIIKLDKVCDDRSRIKICYEATYLGFDLQRALERNGYHCNVVAPSHIPRQSGKHQKTDKIDARKLAVFYSNGLLNSVHVPDPETEADRDLLRSRKFLVGQMTAIKQHIENICRRNGWNFKQETASKSLWTKSYVEWLEHKCSYAKCCSTRINLRILLKQYHEIRGNIELYESELEHLSENEKYKEKMSALLCYRGISTVFALTILTEIGEIKRFKHPKSLTGYAGLDLHEYSSGGKEHRFGITKAGNRHLRRSLIEANQMCLKPPKQSRYLKERRKGIDLRYIEVADRCMKRLNKKGMRLKFKDKPQNKIKVACAREMLGFIWESLMLVDQAA